MAIWLNEGVRENMTLFEVYSLLNCTACLKYLLVYLMRLYMYFISLYLLSYFIALYLLSLIFVGDSLVS